MPYGSVFPLVTARALAREFTYEVEEGVERGAIVSMPFGRSRARGIVVSLGQAPPLGVKARPIDGVVGSVPPALVDLALWLAEDYGSAPGRPPAPLPARAPKRPQPQGPPARRPALSRGGAAGRIAAGTPGPDAPDG